jgi:hypothetical protein
MIKSRKVRLAGHAAGMGAMRNTNTILVGHSEGKRLFVISRRTWEVSIKTVLNEIWRECVDWF